jgi:hypothetical protein
MEKGSKINIKRLKDKISKAPHTTYALILAILNVSLCIASPFENFKCYWIT